MHRSRFLASALAALALYALGASVPPPASAQSIHPLNMVSGVDSVSSLDGYQKTFYAVPSGQTLVLTDMTTEATSNKALLFDGLVPRYILTRVAIGGMSLSSNYLSLSTGIVFQAGHQLTLQILDTGPDRFSWSGYLVPAVVVGVAPSETEQRLGFALMPNPSGQVVELRFELRKAADVSLRIYDVQGQLVTTLADARMPMGMHNLSWTGETRNGVMAASGVYFARLESSEAKSVRRFVRLR